MKLKNKFVIQRNGLGYSNPVYYDKEGKMVEVAGCGCGGSMYFCNSCKKLIVHEIIHHKLKNWVLMK